MKATTNELIIHVHYKTFIYYIYIFYVGMLL